MDRIKKRHVEVICKALGEYTWTDVTDDEFKYKIDPKTADFESMVSRGGSQGEEIPDWRPQTFSNH